jgi:hypothetical protein
VSLIIHPQFRLYLLLSCLCSRLRLQGLAFLAMSIYVTHIDNQQSSGVVTTMAQSSIQSLHHQHRDLHQSTYLYLLKDRDPTSHHGGRWTGGLGCHERQWRVQWPDLRQRRHLGWSMQSVMRWSDARQRKHLPAALHLKISTSEGSC